MNQLVVQAKEPYKSIISLQGELTLPDFTVITGTNGSGKTQLLEFIRNKGMLYKVNNVILEDIVYHTSGSLVPDTGQSMLAQCKQGSQNPLVNELTKIEKQFNRSNLEVFAKLSKAVGKPFLELQQDDFPDQSLYPSYCTFMEAYEQSMKREFPVYFEYSQHNAFSPVGNEARRFVMANSELILPIELFKGVSEAYITYFKRYHLNRYNRYRAEKLGEDVAWLTDEQFKKINLEKPWVVINKLLKKFDIRFELDDPETNNLNLFNIDTFNVRAIDPRTQALYNLSDISSGEKTILALIILLYNEERQTNKEKQEQIRLFLLDEVDAFMHPSMIKLLIHVIEEYFVKNKINVILTTHSPTTIALSPEESVFSLDLVAKNHFLNKKTKSDAMGLLSDGYISTTITDVVYDISESTDDLPWLLVEGITDKWIIKTAFRKLYPNSKFPYHIQACGSASQVRQTLNEIEMEHEKLNNVTTIGIFDFDGSGYDQWTGCNYQLCNDNVFEGLLNKHIEKNLYALLLPVHKHDKVYENVLLPNQNEEGHPLATYNNRSLHGIEHMFYGFTETNDYFNSDPGLKGQIVFKETNRGKQKNKFAKNIVKDLPVSCFENFKALFKSLETILKR